MFNSLFFRRLFVPYLLLICAAVAGVGFFAGVRLRSSYLDSRHQQLTEEILLCSELIRSDLGTGQNERLNAHIRAIGDEIHCRITVIAADGTVLADNWANPAVMENHANRPEILRASSQGQAFMQRTSATIHDDMLYLAHRVDTGPNSFAYLRLAVLIKDLDRQLLLLYSGLAAVAAAASRISSAVCF